MENYDELSLVELRLAGRKLGIKKVTTFRKPELLELVKEAAKQQKTETGKEEIEKAEPSGEKKAEKEELLPEKEDGRLKKRKRSF